jgi:predicted metal-binding membrane protein
LLRSIGVATSSKGTFVATGQFLLGYLAAWTAFSVFATLAQWGLHTAALVSPMMESTSKALGAGLLLIAGLFPNNYSQSDQIHSDSQIAENV